MTEEEIAEKQDKIRKAERKVAEAKERLKMQHNQVHEKMMETKKAKKEK